MRVYSMPAIRLKTKLLLSVTFIMVVMALSSMLVVSSVISGQYLAQSRTSLDKAASIISDTLTERKASQLTASRQLAMQPNLGSTIWYLAQYQLADANREMLFVTYQKLVSDTCNIGRAAKLSDVYIYDAKGQLVVFASFVNGHAKAGFVEHAPESVFRYASLIDGEELNRNNMQTVKQIAGLAGHYPGTLPQHESVQYAVVNGQLAIESHVPVTGEVFDAATGQQQTRQLGLVVMVQPLAQGFVGQMSKLTDTKINIFTPQGLSSGNLMAYTQLGGQGQTPVFNEIKVGSEPYYQRLIPVLGGQKWAGTIAVLTSEATVRENLIEMRQLLWLKLLASLLLVLPFAWYLANTISRPLTLLSRIFMGVASGREELSNELGDLATKRGDELGDLTQSFIAMNNAIQQKILQINEINASLEEQIDQRTRELKLANHELTKLATHDVLTGLPNRQLVSDRLVQALVSARRDKSHVALMFIDLDEFKPVNDTYGHATGDLLLIEVAKRIHDCLRESDTVSRVGGDEFIVLLPVIDASRHATDVAEKIRSVLNLPFELADEPLFVSCSIGVAIYPEHGQDESHLLKNADVAMYEAKHSGRNQVKVFQPAAADN